VSVFFVFLQKNIAQKPVEGSETVEEAFSCTPPEIVSTAIEPECTLLEHGLLFKNCNYCTFNFHIRLYKPYTAGKLVKKAFDQCNNKYGVPFEKKTVFDILNSLCLKSRICHATEQAVE
jgi:hypothetical protein